MEGRGPGDGTPKKLGVIVSGHNPLLFDLFCSRLIGLDYKKIPFLNIAIEKGLIFRGDFEKAISIQELSKFKPGNKTLMDRMLLNNFFIGIRFSKTFQGFFNKGVVPWMLFKMGVKQDKYILDDCSIEELKPKANISKEENEKLKNILKEYCPMCKKDLNAKNCLKCMYCYQMAPELIDLNGNLGYFEMQMQRFGGYLKN